jgi:hypothetical protein
MNQNSFKSIRRILFILGLAVSLSIMATFIVYEEGVWVILSKSKNAFAEHQRKAAIANYGTHLPEFDEVCVLTLVETELAGNLGRFTAPYTHQKLFIQSSIILAGEEAQEIGVHWRNLVFGDGGAACFEPHHVLQFRLMNKVICESVVCFHCSNLTLPAFPRPVLIGFYDSDVVGESTKLHSLLEKAKDRNK